MVLRWETFGDSSTARLDQFHGIGFDNDHKEYDIIKSSAMKSLDCLIPSLWALQERHNTLMNKSKLIPQCNMHAASSSGHPSSQIVSFQSLHDRLTFIMEANHSVGLLPTFKTHICKSTRFFRL